MLRIDRMFDGLQILSNTTNTIKRDQTRSNSTKQGVQTVNCFVTKKCLMVFGRHTFPVCPGPYIDLQLFRQRLSHKSVKGYATMPIGIMGRKSLALIDRGSQCLPTRNIRHKFICLCCFCVAETT